MLKNHPWKKLFEEKEKEMQETQRLVANKLASAESRAVNAQQKLESAQNELMETQRKYEEDRIAKNEEIELIMNDLGTHDTSLLILNLPYKI